MNNLNSGTWQPLPMGIYAVAIAEAQVAPNKKGTGSWLRLKYEVIDGPHAKKSFSVWYNFSHQNTSVADGAWQELGKLASALGLVLNREAAPDTFNSLLYSKLRVGVQAVAATQSFGAHNKIMEYLPLMPAPVAQTSAVAQPATPQQSAAVESAAQTLGATPVTPGGNVPF